MDDITDERLVPLITPVYFANNGNPIYWHDEVCIYIYTNRNKAKLQIIGTVDASKLYTEPLLWEPLSDRFFWCGDVKNNLGIEAYIQYCRDNNKEI